MKPPKPRKNRELLAEMEIKELSLSFVAGKAKMNYTTASEVLNWVRRDFKRLAQLEKVIKAAPMPVEVIA